jgi:hypothetical protein
MPSRHSQEGIKTTVVWISSESVLGVVCNLMLVFPPPFISVSDVGAQRRQELAILALWNAMILERTVTDTVSKREIMGSMSARCWDETSRNRHHLVRKGRPWLSIPL